MDGKPPCLGWGDKSPFHLSFPWQSHTQSSCYPGAATSDFLHTDNSVSTHPGSSEGSPAPGSVLEKQGLVLPLRVRSWEKR